MLPTTVVMVKRDGKLINAGVYDKVKTDIFLDLMKEGELAEVTYEIKHTNGSYSQLSRLHASIRALATETGEEFERMKLLIKQRCGLVMGDQIKSFGDCSKEELSEAIRVCIEIGDTVGVNLHG